MIPILDLEAGSEIERAKDLVEYLGTVGFVYLKSHGISESKLVACRQAANGFFTSDKAFKKSFINDHPVKYIGYKGFETERLNPRQKAYDMREAMVYDWHKIATNAWPDEPSKVATVSLMEEMRPLAARILKMIGVGLKLDNPDLFYEAHTSFHAPAPSGTDSTTSLRINRYPKISPDELKEDQVLCGEHADYGTITFLVQDHVNGLEVKMADGTFVEATPMEGTILLNIGLMLENWTNGRLKATRHRIVRPTVEERMSLVFFVLPDEDVLVRPLRELFDDATKEVDHYPAYNPSAFCRMMLDKIQREDAELSQG